MTDAPKVVELRRRVDAETVEKCRDLLARAEAGEIRSIMAICETPDGGRLTVFTACDDLFAKIASATVMQHRLVKRLLDGTKDET